MNRQPAVFIGHGSPMNALEDNIHTAAWRALGAERAGPERPRAILVISAHWQTHGLRVTAMAAPRTIHDFRGFPQPLFDVQYAAPGAPDLARRVAALLAPEPVALDLDWGLDHGAWQVLLHLAPAADIPVVQLSLDRDTAPARHVALGRRLAALRDEGVMILGSGNVVHNLGLIDWHSPERGFDWAVRFNDRTRQRFLDRDLDGLADYAASSSGVDNADARLSVPTDDHYLPLLYVAGAADAQDPLSVITDGLVMGSLSMLSLRAG